MARLGIIWDIQEIQCQQAIDVDRQRIRQIQQDEERKSQK
jgi:hypothetical protein